jgi:hypothetical protein
MVPRVPESAARRLAFYASRDVGVLAPRGWHCFGIAGSNGSSLVVAPQAPSFRTLQEASIVGPAVAISYSFGGTSGRSAVAAAIERYFPTRHAFVEQVRSLGLPMDSPRRYAADQVRRIGNESVEVTTPGRSGGVGTAGSLAPAALPVISRVTLVGTGEPDLLTVSARLPSGSGDLASIILATEPPRPR